MDRQLIWCAIGDSFTYLNDHLDETGYRVKAGYLTRTIEKLTLPVKYVNLGINGSATTDWLEQALVPADIYTILLGTNDWFSRHTPVGTEYDYAACLPGTILGNLAYLIRNIRRISSQAPILVMNPVERGDFVYIANPLNHAHGSYMAEGGQWLSEVARNIYETVAGSGVYPVDLHTRSGFTPEKVVAFKRLKVSGRETDLAYPAYVGLPYDPENDPYPYPEAAADLTYDGLHPSDRGNEIIAGILADEMERVLTDKIREGKQHEKDRDD